MPYGSINGRKTLDSGWRRRALGEESRRVVIGAKSKTERNKPTGSVCRDGEILCILFDATNNAKAGQISASVFGKKIGQDGWEFKDGWKTCKVMGKWHGVTTNNAEGRVIGLELDENDLAGIIPPQLGDLDALERLSLTSNRLEGGIPKELGKLQALRKLDLFLNPSLGGVIPPELGDLSALEELHLRRNGLGGDIPPELGKLHALKTLQLSYNNLDGAIPPELGDLNALEELQLSRNRFEGNIPPELGKLHGLKKLDLSGNKLDGSIPAELGNLDNLQILLLQQNQLAGCIPPQLGNLQALHTLNLDANNLTGLWDHTQDVSLGQGAQGVSGSPIPKQLSRLLEILRTAEEATTLSLLGGNPWAEPPEAVLNSGMAAVIVYFEALYSSPCKVRRNSVKVVLVGQEGAGKTSLCRSMKTGRATLTDRSTESTVYADVERMELDGASVRVYDCAGQVAYTGLLQMFLTPRAVCLVVCDAGAFEQRDGEERAQLKNDICALDKLRVCDWLRSISQRVPRSDVILVATKCDLTDSNAAEVAGRLDAACRVWLASGVAADMEPVRLEDGVSPSLRPSLSRLYGYTAIQTFGIDRGST